MSFKAGSEWRKWDLHIHSDASDGHMTVEEIIDKALELKIDVIALTDHHTSKNIDEAIRLGSEKGVVVIPGVEFRTEYGTKSVHMIGLFPYEWKGTIMNTKGIYDEILAPLGLTEAKIRNAGKSSANGKLTSEKEFSAGLCKVQVDFKRACEKIHEYGGLVSVHHGSKANGLDEEMKHEGTKPKNVQDPYESLGPVKEELFSKGFIDICEVRTTKDSCDFYWNKFKRISILASDAHRIEEIGRNFSWIKADPTFEGLRQALIEKDRVYLGEKPEVLKRVNLNPNRYIKTLKIDRQKYYSDESQKWFEDVEIPLNSELVAIIGNKGSGKSAIADIIGLLLNSDHYNDFQFLKSERFLKKGLADNFFANLELCSGQVIGNTPLSKKVNLDESVKVKYLPQQYFESICNEIGKVNRFRSEIENVVYQYLPQDEKLGKASFDDYIHFKSDNIGKEIALLKNKLNDINNELIHLEDKSSPAYITKIKSQKEYLESQLHASRAAKPKEVVCPTDEMINPELKQFKDKLASLHNEHNVLNQVIVAKKTEISEIKIEIENINRLRSSIKNKCDDFFEFLTECKAEAEHYGIEINDLVKLEIDLSTLDSKITEKLKEVSSREVDLNGNSDQKEIGLIMKKSIINNEINLIREKLNKEEKEYQLYLDDLNSWSKNINSLIGDETTVGSLKYYEKELSYINETLPSEINRLREMRKDYSIRIFKKKLEIKRVYDDIKIEIDETLKSLGTQSIEIVSCMNIDEDFEALFLNYVNKKKASSYLGTDSSKKFLKEYVIGTDALDDESGLISFLDRIISSLEEDYREPFDSKRTKTFIGDIVNDRYKFYAYIFSLDYLTPKYEMVQNGKTLDELSPGEKGGLLLVFYLALDKTEMPIIIDQPEDNLDNHSVTKILVPFIREAKKYRQIIMVTHNPNLAVVSDAEQIIYVNIDKTAGNKFEYLSGSIENPEINDKIVDILEGTMPAFKVRKSKYHASNPS